MHYSDIIGIESFFDSTFNMTEERENYWKQFITNEKFESNLKAVVNAFTSPIIIFVFLLLTRFFSHFHFFIEIFSKSMSFPLAINHGYSDV